MDKQAILTVSFGTTYPQARKRAITATEEAIQKQFDGWDVVRAFTSSIVRKRIYEHENIIINDPDQALQDLMDQGYQTVVVQPLHIIPGTEFNILKKAVCKYQNNFKTIKLSEPLLTEFSDYQRVTQFIQRPRPEKVGNLWMGHGTAHSAFATYACLDHMLLNTNSFLAAVESYPDIDLIIKRILATSIKKVYLQPFMLVAGNHAHLDMASNDPDSWKSKLQSNDIEVVPELRGLGEYKEIQQMFINKLNQTIKRR